jgi:RNA polymerase sigma factor (sigma-70 family)
MLLPASHDSRDRDAQLVDALRAGDERAFEEIVARHRPRLLAFARRILRTRPDSAEDIVQEALMRAHRALLRDDRTILLGPWLAKLTRNCALDEISRIKTDSVPLDAPAAVRALVDHDSPAEQHERRATLRGMLDGIATLPTDQRHALLRREVDGASHADVAAELDITIQASRQLVFRARANLAKQDDARGARCTEVQDELLRSSRAGRRASAHAHRHLATCRGCRSYRGQLRAMRAALHALHPGGLLFLGVVAAKLGIGGATTKAGGALAAATTAAKTPVGVGLIAALSAAAAVGGTLVVHTGEPSPVPIRSAALPGGFLAQGSPLPPRTDVVARLVRTTHGSSDVRLTCPGSSRVADLLPPQGGAVTAGYVGATTPGVSRVAHIRLSGSSAEKLGVAVLCRVPDAAGAVTPAAQARLRAVTGSPLQPPRKPIVVCVDRAYLSGRPGSGTTGSVHSTQPLRELGRRGGWRHVATEFGTTGWLPATDLCG